MVRETPNIDRIGEESAILMTFMPSRVTAGFFDYRTNVSMSLASGQVNIRNLSGLRSAKSGLVAGVSMSGHLSLVTAATSVSEQYCLHKT